MTSTYVLLDKPHECGARAILQVFNKHPVEVRGAVSEHGYTVHRWLGEVDSDGSPLWQGRPVSLGAHALTLPHRGEGCRPEHRPFLDAARRVLGTGVPLAVLTGGDSCDEPAWEYDNSPADSACPIRVFRGTDDGNPAWKVDEEADDDGDPIPPAIAAHFGAVLDVADDEDEDPTDYQGGDDHIAGPFHVAVTDDGDLIGVYVDRFDAEDAARQAAEESRYGYPWAHGWAYHLKDDYHDEEIRGAGFTIATQTATGERFAGVDGGGYCFESSHHAPLGAAVLVAADRYAYLREGATGREYACIPVGPALQTTRAANQPSG